MEVHHTHSPRKKWIHYLWEFLMLFFAVTLGFFVENQREHYIEHKREKQFIRSLINDVMADTARMGLIVKARLIRESRLDSLSSLLNGSDVKNHTGQIYSIAISAARTLAFRFVPNEGTMQQLKNSGAFRLIRDPAVRDSISKYDISTRTLARQSELEETLIDSYREAATRIFNSLEFRKMLDADNNVIRSPEGNPPLLPFRQEDLHVFNYRLYSMSALNKANRRDARFFLKEGEQLLKLLKARYGFD